MMLMLENWVTKKFELAMLVDESPYEGYAPSTTDGEAWRASSTLTAASRSVDLEGHAWLYVIFVSDKPSTWGTKLVKLVVGGTIFAKELQHGIWTGRYISLMYQVVARHIFGNIVGRDSKAPFKIILRAEIQNEAQTIATSQMKAEEDRDENLGIAVPQIGTAESQDKEYFVPQSDLGCTLTWQDSTKYTEKWFVQDVQCFNQYRFYLTEYQRRQYVQIILSRLGFVAKNDSDGSSSSLSLAEACNGHLKNVANSLQALVRIAKQDRSSGA